MHDASVAARDSRPALNADSTRSQNSLSIDNLLARPETITEQQLFIKGEIEALKHARQNAADSPARQPGLPATALASYSAAMANHAEPYRGIPGFNIEAPTNVATPSSPPPERSLIDNHELITDLARYAEGVLTEKQVRKKHHLFTESTWTALNDDAIVEAVELEQTRRIRSGAAKRELAQLHIIKGPAILDGIATDKKQSAKHRIDSIKALDALATPESQAASEQERIFIRIDLSADTRTKGQQGNPGDILELEAAVKPKSKTIDNWDAPERGPSRTDNDSGNNF